MARYRRSYSSVSRKTISNYKWGIAVVSVLAIFVIALAIFTKGFTNWDVKTWFPTNEVECEHIFEDGKCTLCDELEVKENVDDETNDVNKSEEPIEEVDVEEDVNESQEPIDEVE